MKCAIGFCEEKCQRGGDTFCRDHGHAWMQSREHRRGSELMRTVPDPAVAIRAFQGAQRDWFRRTEAEHLHRHADEGER